MDGCGSTAKDDADAQRQGWLRGPITGRWRCAKCLADLANVNHEHNHYEPR
jgi:hypothetical protein